jgi:Flp pilus assembly pilin Flp
MENIMNKSTASGLLKRIRTNEQGVSMIEFALLLPILIVILLGTVEITRMVLFHQKLDNATARVADLITRLNTDTVSCDAGAGGLEWMKTEALADTLAPFETDQNTITLVVSAVIGEYRDDSDHSDDEVLRHRVEWQWQSGSSGSFYGGQDSDLSEDTDWPQAFRLSPNQNGLWDGDRVIAVEAFYNFTPLLSATENFLPFIENQTLRKTAFYRSRFGKLGNLDCPSI